MELYHVFLRERGRDERKLFFRDLSERDLKSRVVRPYRKSRALVSGGAIIPVESLAEIRIAQSDTPFEKAFEEACDDQLRRNDELNRDSAVHIFSFGPSEADMADVLEDVTERFLRGEAPGTAKSSIWVSLSNNRTLGALFVGLVLAAVYYYFGIRR